MSRGRVLAALLAAGACSAPAGDAAGREPAAAGAAPPPRIFFTDLRSGPADGGEGGDGAFVTIHGARFGARRAGSRVTVGGGAVHAYRRWTDREIVVQLGGAARTGDVVVRTAAGRSNGVHFTVRDGGIFFVARGGDDGASGSLAHPWASVAHAADALRPGDVAYLRDGVRQVGLDAFNAALSIESSGRRGQPKAIVAYPGATARVGSSRTEFGGRVPNLGEAVTDWVLAGLELRGRLTAFEIGGVGSRRWRIVGNDVSCPRPDAPSACFAASLASRVRFLGNEVHGIGARSGTPLSKLAHAVYFTTDTNRVEVGWNHIHDNRTCRAVQFHSSPLGGGTGLGQHHLSVHDNVIDGDVCDGVNLATVDPSRGPVRVFDNVITAVGRGPAPPDGDANYACVYVAGITNNGPPGRGTVEVFHNTMVDCGARGGSDAGAVAVGAGSPGLGVRLRDNLVRQRAGESYLAPATDVGRVRGARNLWYGGADDLPGLPGDVHAAPAFVDGAAGDFRLRRASPAVDAGGLARPPVDLGGVRRPQGAAPDLGAFERPRAA